MIIWKVVPLYGITGMEFKKRLEELAKILDFENLLKRTVVNYQEDNAEELILQGLCFISLKSLFLMSRQQGLIRRHADLFGMLYQVFAKMKNMTVFLTTHYMEEAAEADYVVIIDDGKNIRRGYSA